MAKTIDIVVPDLGDFADVEIIEILVSDGDDVAKEDGLITLETDKAAMDVPAPESGKLQKLTVSVGDTVSAGDVIGQMEIDVGGDTVIIPPPSKAPQAPAADEEAPAAVSAAPAPAASSAGGLETLRVPDLGDFADVEVIEVLVAKGDEVAAEDGLVTLETDKAAMDVPASVGGIIEELLVSVGDKVSTGSDVAVVRTSGTAPAAAPAAETKPAAEPATAPAAQAETPAPAPAAEKAPEPAPAPAATGNPARIDEAGFARSHASPSVRKLARELGVDLVRVKGSGAKGRILHDDVKAFVKSVMTGQAAAPSGGATLPKTPSVDFSKFGEIELEPLTRIQKISGPRLQASWINIPHVTQHDEADITELEERRQLLKGPAKERGIPLTPLAFIIKACVSTLKEFPKVNSSLADDGENLVMKKYCHIGFAADTDQGLVVPVIRDADKKDVYELAAELAELSALAREGKLKAPQLQGACFTISSLGGIGGTAFTPIVNSPEVAILGVSRSAMKPVWDGEQFQPKLILPYALSYDHRVIDGALAVRFTTSLASRLANVDELLQAIP
ncbi:MAG: dihydrolipoyllysine-residue acetyltransferase [Woeseiaceae bacterium]|nr:dihydrolipoyllysine-residue acetyltransferase [Woeseiaceae bacterium]